MSEEKRQSVNAADDSKPGPFLARIVSHLDPYYMGTLEVELLHSSGNQNSKEGQIHQVKYMSPFAGITSVAYIDENNDYNSTQHLYQQDYHCYGHRTRTPRRHTSHYHTVRTLVR
jgi:hypothetical protein